MAINQPVSDSDPGQKCQKEHLCVYLRKSEGSRNGTLKSKTQSSNKEMSWHRDISSFTQCGRERSTDLTQEKCREGLQK